MNGLMKAATTSATLALLAAGAAKADILTLPPVGALAQSGACDASSGCGPTVAYTAFTVSQDETITGFTYYSYLTSATYLSTNWSLWTGSPSPSKVDSSGSTPIGGPGSATVVNATSGLVLISVSLDPSAYVTVGPSAPSWIGPNTQYWIGLQNNINVTGDGTSVFAGTGQTYTGGTLYDGTTALGGADTWQLPAYEPSYKTWIWMNAAVSIQTKVGPIVPEPSTWAMVLIGFGGLGWAARRRLQAA